MSNVWECLAALAHQGETAELSGYSGSLVLRTCPNLRDMTRLCAVLALLGGGVAATSVLALDRNPSLTHLSDEVRTNLFDQQDQKHRRREAANTRALRSICEAGCRGELPRHTQPADPFAQLPSWDDPPDDEVQEPNE